MENQELLEQLQHLQRSLQEIDAARQMVIETIEAYNGVSSRIESYSTQLSSVSDRISQLINLIGQNRDILSSDIDTRVDAAMQKAEQTSDRFSQKTTNALTSFKNDTQAQIRDLNTAITNLVTEAQRAISQATVAATELQDQSAIALENAYTRINTAAEEIVKRIDNQLSSNKSIIMKRVTWGIIIVSVIILGCFAVLLLKG